MPAMRRAKASSVAVVSACARASRVCSRTRTVRRLVSTAITPKNASATMFSALAMCIVNTGSVKQKL